MSIDASARQRFLEDYRYIRNAEGRGSDRAEYYRALPYNDLSGLNRHAWKMRARTYSYFVTHVLKRFEETLARRMDSLDLGAGNCWMSYRLKQRGHCPVALDIFRDERDGLMAARHYPVALPAVEAEFDNLPFKRRRSTWQFITPRCTIRPTTSGPFCKCGIVCVLRAP